jgi:hypothetical protein
MYWVLWFDGLYTHQDPKLIEDLERLHPESVVTCPEDCTEPAHDWISCADCGGGGWIGKVERLEDGPDGFIEQWWEPCETCNRECRRVPKPPEEDPGHDWLVPDADVPGRSFA